jgi:3-hydroxyisobutyrate dehydrogenase-like beta-hydroxyacid dehydrogenase
VSGVAVIGLGDLGLACATRLHAVGVETIGVDPSPERRDEWHAATGLTAVASVDEARAERTLVCVRTTDQAKSVLVRLDEIGGPQATTAYVVTTLEPGFARRLSELATDNVRVIELPISGGRAGAVRGDLTVMVGGPAAQDADIRFLEASLAQRVFRFERFGDATLVKLLNNTLGAYNAAAFAACVRLADEAGISPSECAAVIRASSGSSWMAEHFAVLIDDLLAKDAALLAQDLGELPTLDLSAVDEFLAALAHARGLIH